MLTTKEGKKYKIPQVKLTYCSDVSPSEKFKILQSSESADIFRDSFEDGEIEFQEYFKVMYLDRGHKVNGIHTLSIGGMEATITDIKIIFTGALLAKASAIIVCHNHPSGNLRPSPQDDNLTRRISDAGKILEIKLLDHIIITADGYYSYQDEGRL